MKIDVIIPTYMPGKYIEDCFLSLNNQTIDFDKFFVVVVLNGPKDIFWNYLSEILSKSKFNYQIIYSDKANVSAARNLGLDKTNNPYILFLDDDDILSSNYLESMLAISCDNKIIVSNVIPFCRNLNEGLSDYLTFSKKIKTNNLVKYRRYLSNSCCKIIPRNIIGDFRFNEKLSNAEDALFMFGLSKKIKFIESTDSNVIYFRRLRESSLSRKNINIISSFYILLKQIYYFTCVYIKDGLNYNFLLFSTRILALIRSFLIKVKVYYRN